MNINIPQGIQHVNEFVVEAKDTAKQYGSGLVEVLATPAMIAMMEKTALETVLEYLPKGKNTVGTEICVKHLKASPVGARVRYEAQIKKAEGKKLEFAVHAWDGDMLVGTGTHTRYIIDTEQFMAKLK